MDSRARAAAICRAARARSPPRDAIKQVERLAMQPHVVVHVVAMPDLHVAHDICVGTVFATDVIVVPAALGATSDAE
ncbi:MAG: RtcB family protein [Myxococcaceae bacterium]